MRITSIDYKGDDMEFEDLHLGQLNLFVSQNGVGKSRVLRKVCEILGCFLYQVPMAGQYNFIVHFIFHNNEISAYHFVADAENSKSIYSEKLVLGNLCIFNRDFNNTVVMYNSLSNKYDEHNIPFDKLAMSVIRDTKKYPVVEDLLQKIEFPSYLTIGKITNANVYEKDIFNRTIESINIAEAHHNLPAKEKNLAKAALILIGYNITDISTVKVQNEYELYIREADLKDALQINQLSQGMLRAVYLVINVLHYTSMWENQIFLIDDITEGLDYARAKKLGKWVFDTCQERGAQLIATTNDSFLMKTIDIEHWNILGRKGNQIQCLNYQNSKELFDEFAFTGLSNFDLFSSNFLDKHDVWKK